MHVDRCDMGFCRMNSYRSSSIGSLSSGPPQGALALSAFASVRKRYRRALHLGALDLTAGDGAISECPLLPFFRKIPPSYSQSRHLPRAAIATIRCKRANATRRLILVFPILRRSVLRPPTRRVSSIIVMHISQFTRILTLTRYPPLTSARAQHLRVAPNHSAGADGTSSHFAVLPVLFFSFFRFFLFFLCTSRLAFCRCLCSLPFVFSWLSVSAACLGGGD